MIDAPTVLGALGALFLALAAWRTVRGGGVGPQARAWWIVGIVFGLVAAWHWASAQPG
jgi:hypothetical protein